MALQTSGPLSGSEVQAELGTSENSFTALMESHSALLKFDNRYSTQPYRTDLTDTPRKAGEYLGYGNLGEIRGLQGRDGGLMRKHYVYATINGLTLTDVDAYFNQGATPVTPSTSFTLTSNPDFTSLNSDGYPRYINPASSSSNNILVSIGTGTYDRRFVWTFEDSLSNEYQASEFVLDDGRYCRIVIENVLFQLGNIEIDSRLIGTHQGSVDGITTEINAFRVSDDYQVLAKAHVNPTAGEETIDSSHAWTPTLNNWYRIEARVYNSHTSTGTVIASGSLSPGTAYYVGGTFSSVTTGSRIEHDGKAYLPGGTFLATETTYDSYGSGTVYALDPNGTDVLVSESISYVYY